MKRLKDIEAGTEVTLRGVVIEQKNGQTLVMFSKFGQHESFQSESPKDTLMWSVVNSAAADEGAKLTPMQRRAIEQAYVRAVPDEEVS